MVSIALGRHMDLIGAGNPHIFFSLDDGETCRLRRGRNIEEEHLNKQAPSPPPMRIHRVLPIPGRHRNEDWKLSVAFMNKSSLALFGALLLGSFYQVASFGLFAGAAGGAITATKNLRSKTIKMQVEHSNLRRSIAELEKEIETAMQEFNSVKNHLGELNFGELDEYEERRSMPGEALF